MLFVGEIFYLSIYKILIGLLCCKTVPIRYPIAGHGSRSTRYVFWWSLQHCLYVGGVSLRIVS